MVKIIHTTRKIKGKLNIKGIRVNDPTKNSIPNPIGITSNTVYNLRSKERLASTLATFNNFSFLLSFSQLNP